jgi:hypothetical protein
MGLTSILIPLLRWAKIMRIIMHGVFFCTGVQKCGAFRSNKPARRNQDASSRLKLLSNTARYLKLCQFVYIYIEGALGRLKVIPIICSAKCLILLGSKY